MSKMVKFDPSKNKTKLFFSFETNNSEKYDAQMWIWFNKMTECITNALAFLFYFV